MPRTKTKLVAVFLLAACVGGAAGGALDGWLRSGASGVAPRAQAGAVGTVAGGLLGGVVCGDPAALLWAGLPGLSAAGGGSPEVALMTGLVGGLAYGLVVRALRRRRTPVQSDEASRQ